PPREVPGERRRSFFLAQFPEPSKPQHTSDRSTPMNEVTPGGEQKHMPKTVEGQPEKGHRPGDVRGGTGRSTSGRSGNGGSHGRSAKDGSALEQLHARRFEGITRPYTAQEVERLSGSVRLEYT